MRDEWDKIDGVLIRKEELKEFVLKIMSKYYDEGMSFSVMSSGIYIRFYNHHYYKHEFIKGLKDNGFTCLLNKDTTYNGYKALLKGGLRLDVRQIAYMTNEGYKCLNIERVIRLDEESKILKAIQYYGYISYKRNIKENIVRINEKYLAEEKATSFTNYIIEKMEELK